MATAAVGFEIGSALGKNGRASLGKSGSVLSERAPFIR